MDQYNYTPDPFNRSAQAVTTLVSNAMKRVYFKMTLALIVTALTALWASTSYGYVSFLVTHTWLIWVLVAAELGLVIAISGAINRLSNAAASGLFYLFAVVNGLMLCTIFLAYSPGVIAKTFFITAGTFGAMSVYGYFTSNDLSRIGSYLIMALFGLIIASVVNIFLHSSTLDWIVSIAGVFIFIGLTAWDTQQIKLRAMSTAPEGVSKLATIGALTLYLDFINLFLYLLRIFGNRD
ncbi:Bax inhibitor-1/YccA family protein [uncultured Duncaniella sp.]|uniref:Bax inhibitor-1/YccA family protein n=1 Tax=uncultured Duncaniella sp. TaxID=2768039 RepID=UPI00272D0026|nr:Bax inhibitor-1/YccA family protein [uncultured Duncaniella sp.]